jgi:hypothetical protein
MRVRPAKRLRPLVASYIDFDMAGWPPGRHRGLPDGGLPLVISLGAPLIVRDAAGADISAAATIAGLRSSPVDIIHDGTQRGIQLELTPHGARALLGLPAAALAHGVWPLDDVVGPRARELVDSLVAAPGPAERVQVLDSILARWAVDDGCPHDRIPIRGNHCGNVPLAPRAEQESGRCCRRRHGEHAIHVWLAFMPECHACPGSRHVPP